MPNNPQNTEPTTESTTVACQVEYDRDGITLWDCPCSECRGIRMQWAAENYSETADWRGATSYEITMGLDN